MEDYGEATARLYKEKFRCLNCKRRGKDCKNKKDNDYCDKFQVKDDFKYKT